MSPPRLRADAARNARRILDAARGVFARDGADAPMEEVAAAAGLGVATVYRRFPTRQALITAVLEQRFGEVITPVLERAASEADPRTAVTLTLEAAVELAFGERPLLAAAADAGALTMDLAHRFFAPVSELVSRGQQEGAFRPDLVPEDTPRLVLMLLGTLPSFAAGDDGWRRYVALLLDALTARPGTTPLPPPSPVRTHQPPL